MNNDVEPSLEALFHAALTRTTPEERVAFLAEVCPGGARRVRLEAASGNSADP